MKGIFRGGAAILDRRFWLFAL